MGAHPVGGAVDAEDDAFVQEPVEEGGGEHGVAEAGGPVGYADVGGGDDGAFEVAGVDDLEEQGAAVLVEFAVAASSSEQKTLGESNRGQQKKSIMPSVLTRAAVCKSPMSP